MDHREIEKLMIAMQKHGTRKLRLKKEGFEVELEGGRADPSFGTPVVPDLLHHLGAMRVVEERQRFAGELPKPLDVKSIAASPPVEEGAFVKSPMVGTFYRASSPQDPPFVKSGDKVEAGTVVCIIEAMKVMNEIKAGVSGTVQKLLVEDGQPVEFGTKLIQIV